MFERRESSSRPIKNDSFNGKYNFLAIKGIEGDAQGQKISLEEPEKKKHEHELKWYELIVPDEIIGFLKWNWFHK